MTEIETSLKNIIGGGRSMRSDMKLALHNVEVSGEEQTRIKNLAIGTGCPHVGNQGWFRFFRKLNHAKQVALLAQWLTDGTIKQIRGLDSNAERLTVVMRGGHVETFDI